MVAQAALTRGDLDEVPMNQMFRVEALSLGPTIQFFGSWLTPLSNPWVVVADPDFTSALQQLGLVLLAGGFVAAIVIGHRVLRERVLAWATGLTGLLGASLFILASFYLQSLYVPPPARYGYALVPAMAVLTATGVKTRPATVTVGSVAVVAVALSVLRLAV